MLGGAGKREQDSEYYDGNDEDEDGDDDGDDNDNDDYG